MTTTTTKYSPPENFYIQLDIVFATEYGVNSALLFDKLHRLQAEWKGYTDDNGDKWVRLTLDEWKKELPFLSNMTIRRTIEDCEEKGLILSTVFERRSKWYRCNPDFIKHNVTVQNEHIQQNDDKYLFNMNTSSVQNEHLPISLPNSNKNSSTTISKNDMSSQQKESLKSLTTSYQDFISVSISPLMADVLKEYALKIQPDWIPKAFYAMERANVKSWAYPQKIFDNCIQAGGWVDKPQRNGASNGHPGRNQQSQSQPKGRTGADLAAEPYYDPATNEHVYPDGRRELVGV